MKTIETLHMLFARDLQELHHLQKRGWFALPMSRVVKEEHLGRCCYLAEELLDAVELSSLKRQLGLSERQWRMYKAKLSQQ